MSELKPRQTCYNCDGKGAHNEGCPAIASPSPARDAELPQASAEEVETARLAAAHYGRPESDIPALIAFERHRAEQSKIPGMPGLGGAIPNFVAGYQAASTRTASDTRTAAGEAECDAARRAAPASQHDATSAILRALSDGIPLQEPVYIGKALRAQREARVSLAGGTGPQAAVMLVNIQLAPWTHTKETAEAYADGYNAALKQYRAALLELAADTSTDAATRSREDGGNTQPVSVESARPAEVDVEAERKLYLKAFPSFLGHGWTSRQGDEFSIWLAARTQADAGKEKP